MKNDSNYPKPSWAYSSFYYYQAFYTRTFWKGTPFEFDMVVELPLSSRYDEKMRRIEPTFEEVLDQLKKATEKEKGLVKKLNIRKTEIYSINA